MNHMQSLRRSKTVPGKSASLRQHELNRRTHGLCKRVALWTQMSKQAPRVGSVRPNPSFNPDPLRQAL